MPNPTAAAPSKPKRETLAAWSAALMGTAGIMLPGVALYWQNSAGLTFRFGTVAPLLAGAAAVCAGVLALPQLLCRGRRSFDWVHAVVAAFGVAIWLQGNFFTEAAGPLTGEMIDWSVFLVPMIVESLLLIAVFAAAVRWRRRLWSYTPKIAAIVILAQLTPLAVALCRQPETDYGQYEYQPDFRDIFHFSRRDNVVLIVVDALGSELFEQAMELAPELAGEFRDFHCFPQMQSPQPKTMFAVPAMLSGVAFDGSPDDDDAMDRHPEYLNRSIRAPGALLPALKQAGYRCSVYPFMLQTVCYDPEWIDNLTDFRQPLDGESVQSFLRLWGFRELPLALKPLLIDKYLWGFRQFDADEVRLNRGPGLPYDLQMLRSIRQNAAVEDGPARFQYIHFHGAHLPVLIDENARQVPPGGGTFSQATAGSLRVVAELLRKMRTLGVYDDAVIVITGDHSERYTPETVSLIKPRRESADAIRVHPEPAAVADLCATLRRLSGVSPETATLTDRAIATPTPTPRPDKPDNVGRLTPTPWQPAPLPDVATLADAPELVYWEGGINRKDGQLQLVSTGSNWESDTRVEFRLWDPVARHSFRSELKLAEKLPDKLDFQLNFADLPDGTYQLLMASYRRVQSPPGELLEMPAESSDFQTEFHALQLFGRWIAVAGGRAQLAERHPDLTPRPAAVGERLRLNRLLPLPQLELIQVKSNIPDHAAMRPESRILIRLPQTDRPLALELEFGKMPVSLETLTVHLGGHPEARKVVSAPFADTLRVRLDLPPACVRRGEALLRVETRFPAAYAALNASIPLFAVRLVDQKEVQAR